VICAEPSLAGYSCDFSATLLQTPQSTVRPSQTRIPEDPGRIRVLLSEKTLFDETRGSLRRSLRVRGKAREQCALPATPARGKRRFRTLDRIASALRERAAPRISSARNYARDPAPTAAVLCRCAVTSLTFVPPARDFGER